MPILYPINSSQGGRITLHEPGCSHCNLWMGEKGGKPGRDGCIGFERVERVRMEARNGMASSAKGTEQPKVCRLEADKAGRREGILLAPAWVPSVVC